MHACVVLAADADAGTVDLGQTVDVVKFDAEFFGDALSHGFAPALGTDDAFFQVDLVLEASLLDLFSEEQSVRRRGTEDGGLHVDHHLELFIGVAGAHRDAHGAEFFRAGLEADTGGPEPVARGDVDAVPVRDAGHLVAAGEHGGPVIDVFASVGDDDRKAGGARGRVDADDLLFRSRHESEGIGVPKVRFLGEGEVLKVFHGGDTGDARFLEFLSVEAACLAERFDLMVDLF